jgi:single-strand DNA-binding protein
LISFFAHFLGHCFGLIPAPGTFAASAFPVPPLKPLGSLPECSLSVWEQKPSLLGTSRKRGKKGETQMYLNSVTVVGFVGADPEQRQSRKNDTKFTVLSLATQRSWKNPEDEWVSKTEWHRVSIFRPRLAAYVLESIKKGAHVLIEGCLVSSIYEQPNGKGKKATTAKITSWSIRAHAVRRLDRREPEPEAIASRSHASDEIPGAAENPNF